LRCNWKVYVENFLDYYHTPVVHGRSIARGSLSVYHGQRPDVTAGPGHYVMIYTRHAGSAALLPGAQGLGPLPTLDDHATEGSSFACVSPCGLIACTKDCVWYVEIHPTGPQSIRLALGACFHRDAVARNDFAERVKPYYERWDVTVDEDNRINEIQQRGVMSPLARAGRVSPLETASHVFRNRLLDALAL
jgi:phenylpropionate dioxygenase-like ring-hydroxylating dioxygenase large terminal subunit